MVFLTAHAWFYGVGERAKLMLKVSSKFKKRTEAFQGEHAETTLFGLAREFLFVSSASRVCVLKGLALDFFKVGPP